MAYTIRSRCEGAFCVVCSLCSARFEENGLNATGRFKHSLIVPRSFQCQRNMQVIEDGILDLKENNPKL